MRFGRDEALPDPFERVREGRPSYEPVPSYGPSATRELEVRDAISEAVEKAVALANSVDGKVVVIQHLTVNVGYASGGGATAQVGTDGITSNGR